ncbi:hypothetical protein scyTo_0019909, partial [Scyliorhinus torazame]|nr:hypothetical protein [Scyliorhinus torazame]
KLYQPEVTSQMPSEIQLEHVASKETELVKIASNISQDMSDVMKHLPTFMGKAEGFVQTLSLIPIMKQSQTNKAIFSTHAETHNEQDLPFGNTDVTPLETNNKKLLQNRSSQKRKSGSCVNQKYPKRRLHLSQ